jgi:hypothetical protein
LKPAAAGLSLHHVEPLEASRARLATLDDVLAALVQHFERGEPVHCASLHRCHLEPGCATSRSASPRAGRCRRSACA